MDNKYIFSVDEETMNGIYEYLSTKDNNEIEEAYSFLKEYNKTARQKYFVRLLKKLAEYPQEDTIEYEKAYKLRDFIEKQDFIDYDFNHKTEINRSKIALDSNEIIIDNDIFIPLANKGGNIVDKVINDNDILIHIKELISEIAGTRNASSCTSYSLL